MDTPALPGFPVTLFGGKGFLWGDIGPGRMGGRRVPGVVAKRDIIKSEFTTKKKNQFEINKLSETAE